MKLEFLGGAKTVTGSCYILKDGDFTVMIDCGMFQGRGELKSRNLLEIIYSPKDIDILILTHAHIDHSGLIPRLVKRGFKGKIYCTTATSDLCQVMLPDSAHIQEMDTRQTNRKSHKLQREPLEPLYTVEDAENSLEFFNPVAYGKRVRIHPRIEITFRDAGHILGSSFIEMWVEEKGKKTKIVFSGDLGPKNQALIRDPEIVTEADILLVESTYGDRLHKSKEDTYTEFKDIILDSYNKEGNIIIPAFAVERTQEIIFSLGNLFKSGDIPKIPVYIDSPLAISATEIFRKNQDCFDEETRNMFASGDSPLEFDNLYFTKSTKESQRLNEEAKGTIIISASGMCTAGRIKYHLLNNLYKSNSSVIFVGYQAEGTLGRRIVEGAKQVRIYGEDVSVNAKIHTLGGFSGHADKNGILDWMGNFKNPGMKVFVVHGEEKAALNLKAEIESKFGFTAYVPNWGEVVDLEHFSSQFVSYKVPEEYTQVDSEMERFTASYNSLIEKYKKARDNQRLIDIKRLKHDISDVRELISVIIDEI